MKMATANAIKTLLRMDPSVTPDVRMAVINAMSVTPEKTCAIDLAADVSVADAAYYLGMSRTTIWRMCGRGELASSRRGKKLYIAGADVSRLKGASGRCVA